MVAPEADNFYSMDVSELEGDGNNEEEETTEAGDTTTTEKRSSKYYMSGNVFTYELIMGQEVESKLKEGHKILKSVSKNVMQFIFKKALLL